MRDFVAKISLTALFVLAIFSASAAEKVTFEANSPLTVAVGEAFRVEFALNAKPDGDTFKAPSFEGFDVLAGPAISQGSSVQIVNGSMTKSVSYTYTFVLLPQAAGNVTIGAAEVKVDGSSYRTRPLPVEIVNEGEGSGARQQSGSHRPDDAQTDAEKNAGVGYYFYYYYWNRHNDNEQPGTMGPMEFAVVRNNVYKLAVTGIAKLGHPRITGNDPDPVDPDDPNEKGDAYLTVSVEVLPWVVRENNIEF